jgi:hypothetical protein
LSEGEEREEEGEDNVDEMHCGCRDCVCDVCDRQIFDSRYRR